jgi:hypothetical protein
MILGSNRSANRELQQNSLCQQMAAITSSLVLAIGVRLSMARSRS